jgi:hypothetical protein
VVLFAGVKASTEEDPILIFRSKTFRFYDNIELTQDKVNLARVFLYESV